MKELNTSLWREVQHGLEVCGRGRPWEEEEGGAAGGCSWQMLNTAPPSPSLDLLLLAGGLDGSRATGHGRDVESRLFDWT